MLGASIKRCFHLSLYRFTYQCLSPWTLLISPRQIFTPLVASINFVISRFFREISMTEDQITNIMREEVESKFPKNCTACGYRFFSLKEYIENTSHLGKPRFYDAEEQNWQPTTYMGVFAFSKCKNCGNTLSINSFKTNVVTIRQLLGWVKKETLRRGIAISELLNDLRVKIENQVLNQE